MLHYTFYLNSSCKVPKKAKIKLHNQKERGIDDFLNKKAVKNLPSIASVHNTVCGILKEPGHIPS